MKLLYDNYLDAFKRTERSTFQALQRQNYKGAASQYAQLVELGRPDADSFFLKFRSILLNVKEREETKNRSEEIATIISKSGPKQKKGENESQSKSGTSSAALEGGYIEIYNVISLIIDFFHEFFRFS